MKKWQRQLAKVEMVRRGSIIFKKQGIKLKGDALGAYAGKLGPRQSLPPLHFGQTRSPT